MVGMYARYFLVCCKCKLFLFLLLHHLEFALYSSQEVFVCFYSILRSELKFSNLFLIALLFYPSHVLDYRCVTVFRNHQVAPFFCDQIKTTDFCISSGFLTDIRTYLYLTRQEHINSVILRWLLDRHSLLTELSPFNH